MPLAPVDMSTYRGQVGFNLRRLRMKKFDTQISLVEAMQQYGVFIHKNTVSNWERGDRLPAIEILPVLAHVLGCRVRTLVPEPLRSKPDPPSSRYSEK